jgi:hypothetical protein
MNIRRCIAAMLVGLATAGPALAWQEGDDLEPPLWTPDTRYDPPVMTLDKSEYVLPDHWMPLAERCPTTFANKWTTLDKVMGGVTLGLDGVAHWDLHGAMRFERIDDRRFTAVLRMLSPFTGAAKDRGPVVVIDYPYLRNEAGGAYCGMIMFTCPSVEAIADLLDDDYSLTQCQSQHYWDSRYDE